LLATADGRHYRHEDDRDAFMEVGGQEQHDVVGHLFDDLADRAFDVGELVHHQEPLSISGIARSRWCRPVRRRVRPSNSLAVPCGATFSSTAPARRSLLRPAMTSVWRTRNDPAYCPERE